MSIPPEGAHPLPSRSTHRAALGLSGVAAAAVLIWQFATVTANYGGNWTGLFCTGDADPIPPIAANQPTYVFPDSPGYDGQRYRYIAHNPWLRAGFARFVDDPRVRYRRILVPAAAHLAALGQERWIDTAYLGVIVFALALGVYWSARLAGAIGVRPAWGIAFLLLPANLVAIDRAVIDGVFCTLVVGLLYLIQRGSARGAWMQFPLLGALALTRETGLVMAIAAVLAALLARRWRTAVGAAMAAIPAVLWFTYVHQRTTAIEYGYRLFTAADFRALWPAYPESIPLRHLVAAADLFALTGVALLFVLALGRAARWLWDWLPNPRQTDEGTLPVLAAAGFALLGLSLLVVHSDHWGHVYSYGRIHSPILPLLAASSNRPSPWVVAPLALMVPRTLMQFAPQFLGVLDALR